ncbi:glycosyltransferase family 4 protein [Cereibacter changlensis]|uniref:Glycosyltransferase family 4 protein n=1 Tax=Cereibacter changlensis TaxID=402884 RepID=A0A4U0Z275_9RHOB|nr:glycosyltransferase family 4 protein [Cereibacter changlensis]TKA97379.1 glycosyltransferase family 4 protein [Cereibacter changlensis]
MRVLLFSKYSRQGASSRLRSFQFLPMLAQAGIAVEVSPLFDDGYLGQLYDNQSARGSVAAGLWRRLRRLTASSRADLIWLEKEALPWTPWPIEGALLRQGLPIVTDYDDALFHQYDLHRNPLVRGVLGRKIDRVMRASSLVMAGNSYLADRARSAGADRVEIVPTVVDVSAYGMAARPATAGPAAIGWIGTPLTWKSYMAPMMPMLARVARQHDARILAVGAGSSATPDPTLNIFPWSEEKEIGLIQAMDIGIMPLDDSPWSRGKCGYKLIQYMACGLPVIASPVGVNTDIVVHGVNGFLAASDEEWKTALRTLLGDPDLRKRMGSAGRRKVEEDYSVQIWGPRLAQLLKDTAQCAA